MSAISERIAGLIAQFRDRVETRGHSVTVRVIDDLPEYPIMDSQTVAARYGVTPRAPTLRWLGSRKPGY